MFKLNHMIRIRNYSSYNRISDVLATRNTKLNQEVKIKGWIKAIRGMKELIFLDVNDGSCSQNLQLVCSKKDKEKISFGASLEASGVLGETAKGQLEIKVRDYKIHGECPADSNYPFVAKQSYPPEYIRQNLHYRSRVGPFNSALRCRHNLTNIINNYLSKENFIQIHTPILTGNDCEGAGEVFTVQPESADLLKSMNRKDGPDSNIFFDKKVYLTVSGQLHLEAMAHGLSNVYTFGPTFRAENSKSPVHLSEFYMLELEESFITSIHDVSRTITKMMKSVSKEFLDKSSDDIQNINKADKSWKLEEHFQWIERDFPTITYEDALSILEKNKSKLKQPPKKEDGLSKEQEIFLAKYFKGPLFVVDWPKEMKSFYMRQNKDNLDLVEALDFIVPNIGELAGGSVREDNYDLLKAKIPNLEALQWYLDLRKYGSVTTGGFGMGFERYLQFLLNIHNIKDVLPYPRWSHNCSM